MSDKERELWSKGIEEAKLVVRGLEGPDHDTRGSEGWDDDPAVRPLYPDCVVTLTGVDGNALAIVGTVKRALDRYMRRELGYDSKQVKASIDRYVEQSLAGDYDNVILTATRWVTVE